jgi:dolichol kinase
MLCVAEGAHMRRFDVENQPGLSAAGLLAFFSSKFLVAHRTPRFVVLPILAITLEISRDVPTTCRKAIWCLGP